MKISKRKPAMSERPETEIDHKDSDFYQTTLNSIDPSLIFQDQSCFILVPNYRLYKKPDL
jgi:hypothetical protein